ncbi:MAG: dTMP kinase [bacterium]|nr:dTMP kinase [bacterium]
MFIALEGIDGSGKSTQLNILKEYLEKNGRRTYLTREPSDLSIGRTIRRYLTGELKADNRVIAALFVADRLEHILDEKEGLLRKQKEGFDIISDRYYFSSYAYQSVDMPMDWIINANSVAAELLKPDIVIFIDIPPEAAMERIKAGREGTELFETKERLTETRNKYFEAFEKLKDRENVIIIDGIGTPGEVNERITNILSKLL